MPAFRYVAIDSSGTLQRGVMEAASEAALIEGLRRQGSIPMRAEPARSGSFVAAVLNAKIGHGGGLRRQEVANFTRELSIMLGAGLDLDRALRFLVETAPNARVGAVLDRIRNAVRDGSSLADALALDPRGFSRLYCGLVRAGEAGGALAETLERLATMLERERALAATVASALIYPALLFVAATGAVVLLLTHVLPEFVPLFAQNGVALPWSTQMLIDISDALGRYGVLILLALIVLGVAVWRLLRAPGPRLFTDRLVLRLPVIGGLSREVLAARLTRTLGTLVLNGVPLIAALGIVQEALGNRAGAVAVAEAAVSAKGGAGLAKPLGASGIFPQRTVYLLRLGEETAQLGALSLRAAEIHEEKARIGIQRLVALLTPAITIVMGLVVAGIVSSVLVAMLSLNDLAQ